MNEDDPLYLELRITVYILSGLYFLLFLVPGVQLIRIKFRAPEVGWTTQKLFFLLTFFSALVRCVFFSVAPWLRGSFFTVNFERYPLFTILNTFPTILFFSTYTLLILFWGEIIYHARNQSPGLPKKLRPLFFTANMLAYLILVALWLLLFFYEEHASLLKILVNGYLAGLYLLTALGFTFFGGRLYLMLKRFPIDSKGRKNKLREVGLVTLICSLCCVLRTAFLVVATVKPDWNFNHFFIGGYFILVEVVPSFLILIILRKAPPKKSNSQSNSHSYSYSRSSENFGYHRVQ